MTTIQITLPDDLAKEAEQAGLLTQESFEKLVRWQLNVRNLERVFEAVDRGNAKDETPYMSPEEVAEEIAVMRAEQRALKTA